MLQCHRHWSIHSCGVDLNIGYYAVAFISKFTAVGYHAVVTIRNFTAISWLQHGAGLVPYWKSDNLDQWEVWRISQNYWVHTRKKKSWNCMPWKFNCNYFSLVNSKLVWILYWKLMRMRPPASATCWYMVVVKFCCHLSETVLSSSILETKISEMECLPYIDKYCLVEKRCYSSVVQWSYISFAPIHIQLYSLTHFGLVTQHNIMDLGQHWFRWWLVA